MAISLKHRYHSNVADNTAPSDNTKIKPSHWNSEHDLILSQSGYLIGRTTAGAGPAEDIPIASFATAAQGATAEAALSAAFIAGNNVLAYIPEEYHADILAGTSTVDLSTYLADAVAALSSATDNRKLVFPAGQYSASEFPNFAIAHATITSCGEVKLRYTGTGIAVNIDGGATGSGIYNLTWGPFTILCPSTAGDALHIQSVHCSKIVRPRIRGCGTGAAGIHTRWCVCTEIDTPQISINQGAWYGAQPQYGILFDKRSSDASPTAYCLVESPLIEGVVDGIYHLYSLGNLTRGGTSEGNTGVGIVFDSPSLENKCVGVDLEVNATADFLINGSHNQVIDCDTLTAVSFGAAAVDCVLRGGAHSNIGMAPGCVNAHILDLVYDRFNDGSAIYDSGTATVKRNLTNGGTHTPSFNSAPLDQANTWPSAQTFTSAIVPNGGVAAAGGLSSSARACHTGGSAAKSLTEGTDTTPSTTETYIAEIFVPANVTATGIAFLNGSGNLGSVLAGLADSAGAVIASSSSTAQSGINNYQRVPFTAPITLKGPATYYVLLQHNNGGNRFRSHAAGDFGAGKKTGETYGTLTTIAPPTTFAAGQGPIASLY